MSSNEKKTDAIPLGDDNSVNREATQTNINEQGQAAGQENPAAKPEKPADKKSGFFRFGKRAKPAPVEEPAPANEAPGAPKEAPQVAEEPETKPQADIGQPVPEDVPKMEKQPVAENPVKEEPEVPEHAPQGADEKEVFEGAPQAGESAQVQKPAREKAQKTIVREEEPEAEPEAAEKNDAPEEKPGFGTRDKAQAPVRPGLCGQIFNGLAHIGPLALICLLACMVWPDYWLALKGQGLYCPAEATSITTFLNSVAHGNMLEPHGLANGSFVAQWPVFTWFVALLALIPVKAELLWPMVSSIGAMLALVAAWCLAHASRFGARAAFAAGLILLCAPIFAPLGHFVGKSALTAALIIFALACFTRGWLGERAWISLPLAFLFTGLAGLSGGIYAFALPLVTSLFFLIWRANLGRSSRADAIFGFGLLLALLGVWLGIVILKGTDAAYLNSLFANAWQRPWPLPADWWLAGLIALAGLFPWILLVICVSWVRVMKTSVKSLSASRHENGSAMVWIGLVLAWALTFVFPGATHIAAITTACLLGVLLGKAFVNLPDFGNRFFFLLNAICLIVAGLFILGLGFDFSQPLFLGLLPIALPAELPALLLSTDATWIIGAICLLGGLLMLRYFRRNRQGGGLIFCVVLSIALAQPAVLMLAPELGAKSFSRLQNLESIEQSLTKALKPAEPAAQEEPQSPNAPGTPDAAAPEAAPAEAQPATTPAAPEAAPTNQEQAAGNQESDEQPAAVPGQVQQPAPEAASPAETENADAQQTGQGAENTAPAENPAPASDAPDATPEAKAENPEAAVDQKTAAEPDASGRQDSPEKKDSPEQAR